MSFTYIKEVLHDFFYLFFPYTCHRCGKEFWPAKEHPVIRCLCEECKKDLPRTYNHRDDNAAEQRLMGKFHFVKGASFCFYTKGTHYSELIQEAKYENHPWVNYELGLLFAKELAAEGWQEGIDVIVPMPIHYRRYIKRGYNQVEYFGKALSQEWGIPMDCHSLKKKKYTQTQVGKTAEERRASQHDVFEIANPGALEGKHVLLIDDVLTTGATMQSCASVLETVRDIKISFLSLGLTN